MFATQRSVNAYKTNNDSILLCGRHTRYALQDAQQHPAIGGGVAAQHPTKT
jgi:hypothetical protein